MHVITRKRLNDFAKMHPDCVADLVQWFKEMRRASFSNIQEVRAVFPHADKVGKFTIFQYRREQSATDRCNPLQPKKSLHPTCFDSCSI
jgi:hypothetical protein